MKERSQQPCSERRNRPSGSRLEQAGKCGVHDRSEASTDPLADVVDAQDARVVQGDVLASAFAGGPLGILRGAGASQEPLKRFQYREALVRQCDASCGRLQLKAQGLGASPIDGEQSGGKERYGTGKPTTFSVCCQYNGTRLQLPSPREPQRNANS